MEIAEGTKDNLDLFKRARRGEEHDSGPLMRSRPLSFNTEQDLDL